MNFDILKSVGTTNERIREVFTAEFPKAEGADTASPEYKKKKADYDLRKQFEARINNRLMEHINFSLKNYQLYSAVDLAWDAPPISQKIFPLILYAQGKLNLSQCASQLDKLKCADQFVKKNDKGEVTDIDLPRFFDVSVNLVRSMVTRRLAAQSNKYNNLFPYFKYESRSTSQVGKLRADIFSQRTDIMADQFDYRHHDTQVYRDCLLYGHSIDFVRSAWERDLHWEPIPKAEGDESKVVNKRTTVTREGLCWTNPHPTRTYWDNAFPLASINTDSGCTYLGFWDVIRYGNVSKNPAYWNRVGIGYNQVYVDLFTTFAQYFSQYYCTINGPIATGAGFGTDLTSANDRKNMIGYYGGSVGGGDNYGISGEDSSMIVANHFEKFVPKEWGFGDYPYPIWGRFVMAGWDTVIYAEILPSTPAAYLGYNEKDDRQVNLGMGHELLTYQDHMSNLQSYLLLSLRSDNHKVLVLDIDAFPQDDGGLALKSFRNAAKGKNFGTETYVLEVSRKKLADLGLKVDDIIKLIETRSSAQITMIFEAMLRLMTLVERLLALSPQEQGQPAPREISATETNLIAGTTESVYNFISDAIDEFRSAKKRITYESYMAFGQQKFRVPVIGRYPRDVIAKAGLELDDTDAQESSELYAGTVIGTKAELVHDYIFTSRDGAERTSNPQAATSLGEVLKTILPIPSVQEALTKKQLFDIINEYTRLAGAFDMKIELDQGGDEPLAPSATQQVQQLLQQITSTLEQHAKQLNQISGVLMKLQGGGQPGVGAAPQMAAA